MTPPTSSQFVRPAVALVLALGIGACRTGAPPDLRPAPVATRDEAPTTSVPLTSSAVDVIPRRPSVPTTDDVARTVVDVFGDTAALHPDSASAADLEPVWDIDVRSYETHERVAHYVQLFSTTAREHFVQRLSRGTRYEPMIRAKLRASGMPEDLTYLALIESGYDPNAYSRAAAVGMWQFMSSTARDVGLRVDWWVDERRDPARATDGAIRFLGDLQKQFGSLYLAAAAYNGGPGRVARGLTRFAGELDGTEGEDRFFALANQDYLRAETKNYVPQLIAAALIAKTPARYGMTLDSASPLAYDSIRVAAGTGLSAIAAASGSSSAVLKDLNPSILRGVTPPDADWWVHVPTGTAQTAMTVLDSMPAKSRAGYRTLTVSGSALTASSLADREGVTVKQLRWFNPTLKSTKKGRLVAGQSVRIPMSDALTYARELPDPSIERYGGEASGTLARNGFHVVRRGESLGSIAKRYGVTVARLRSLNGLRGTKVIAGQTLRVSSKKSSTKVAVRSSTSAKSSGAKSSGAKSSGAKSSGATSSAAKSSTKKATAKKSSTKKSTASKATAKKSTTKKKSTTAKRP